MKYIFGIVGENGAGKGTVSTILAQLAGGKSVVVIRFSDILFQTLKLWNLSATRVNLQNLAIAMNKEYGEGTLTRAVEEYIKSQKVDFVIVEGIRWLSDVPMIRSFPNSFIVYVTADPKIRFERMKRRGEKEGEDKKTIEDFEKEEMAKTEIEIKNIGASADVKLVNNGEPAELEKQIKLFYASLI